MTQHPFSFLPFDRRLELTLSRRTVWILFSTGAYLLAWRLLSPTTFLLVTLPIFIAFSYLSSLSWKQGLKAVSKLITKLEEA